MTKHKQIVAQLLTFTALASISVGCGDDLAVTQALGDLKAEAAIDFGDVQRGIISEIEFELRNEGDGQTTIDSVEYGENWTTADYEFKIGDPGQQSLPIPNIC